MKHSSDLEFWFDFSSTYAYFAARDVNALAERAGVTVTWRPFMLGAVFAVTGASGLSSTPLKKDYAMTDWRREARRRGETITFPKDHPITALAATRAFYAIEDHDPEAAVGFAQQVFAQYYRGKLDTNDPAAVAALAAHVGLSEGNVFDAMQTTRIKSRAKTICEEGIVRGVCGSPFFFFAGEPFWGWDRMPMLERWITEGGW